MLQGHISSFPSLSPLAHAHLALLAFGMLLGHLLLSLLDRLGHLVLPLFLGFFLDLFLSLLHGGKMRWVM